MVNGFIMKWFSFINKITTVLAFCVFFNQAKAQHLHPAISFDYSNLCYGNFTFFTNTTVSNAPATYTWNVFQQGFTNPVYTATTTNIIYTFPAKDTYTVQLCADNGGGHSDCIQQVFVMDSLIHADFQYLNCDGRFNNFSTCSTTQFWDFGDGNTSTLKHPAHYYANTGTYTVKLVVHDGAKKDSISKPIYAYNNPVTGNFTHFFEKDSVLFLAHDTLIVGDITYHWEFGDGTEVEIVGYSGKKVRHKYPAVKKDSTYKAILHVEVFCNEWETEKDIFIADSVKATETLVYPNPSNGNVYVESERKSQLTAIKIYNAIGQEISGLSYYENLRGYVINTTTLSKGSYILRLYFGDNDIKNYKIIIP